MAEQPPIHPNCRCAVERKTWDGPVYQWRRIDALHDRDFRKALDTSTQAILSAFHIPLGALHDDQHNSWRVIGGEGILVHRDDQGRLVFQEEKTMYEHRDFRIKEFAGVYVDIEVNGLDSLPAALRRLAELGYDMTKSLEALEEACEEQRKRKALDDAIKEMTKKAE